MNSLVNDKRESIDCITESPSGLRRSSRVRKRYRQVVVVNRCKLLNLLYCELKLTEPLSQCSSIRLEVRAFVLTVERRTKATSKRRVVQSTRYIAVDFLVVPSCTVAGNRLPVQQVLRSNPTITPIPQNESSWYDQS